MTADLWIKVLTGFTYLALYFASFGIAFSALSVTYRARTPAGSSLSAKSVLTLSLFERKSLVEKPLSEWAKSQCRPNITVHAANAFATSHGSLLFYGRNSYVANLARYCFFRIIFHRAGAFQRSSLSSLSMAETVNDWRFIFVCFWIFN